MFGPIGTYKETDYLCGGKHESYMEGYSEEIKSKDIESFSYVGGEFNVSAKKENSKVKIFATGGGKYNIRDGSYFIIKYETEDDSIFKKLQEIVEKYNISKENGHCVTIDGLPAGLGDIVNILYSSGEKIYKHSNQFITITEDAIKEIYETFHEFVKKSGYDFTSDGSNVKLFDDADKEFVQGTWTGKHFGDEIEVTFKEDKVTIKVNGKVTDSEEEYIIVEGFIQKNKKKEGREGNTRYDYEDFNGVECFSKKNWFTMTGYYYNNGSSSCDLMNFKKEKPIDEK